MVVGSAAPACAVATGQQPRPLTGRSVACPAVCRCPREQDYLPSPRRVLVARCQGDSSPHPSAGRYG
eukprot:5446503-Pyramimonas_sp.AAC.1